jgi:hypothetical protein
VAEALVRGQAAPWGPESGLRPPPVPRIGRSGRIDTNDPTPVRTWDYADEVFPPGALEPEPAPDRLAYAHRLDHEQPDATAEVVLDVVLDLWRAWTLKHKPDKPWMKGRRPFQMTPERW